MGAWLSSRAGQVASGWRGNRACPGGFAIFAYLAVALFVNGYPTNLPGFGQLRKGYFACPGKLHATHTRERHPVCYECSPPVSMVPVSAREYRRIRRR